jgi:hypothetical protein
MMYELFLTHPTLIVQMAKDRDRRNVEEEKTKTFPLE